jgi:hypothetical protein
LYDVTIYKGCGCEKALDFEKEYELRRLLLSTKAIINLKRAQ